MDHRATMAVSHRSHHDEDAQPLQPSRYRRRRRPTLWDVTTPSHQTSSHNPSVSSRLQTGQNRQVDAKSPYVPRPTDVVHAPSPGESGPLAGIDIPALLRLLRSSATPRSSHPSVNSSIPLSVPNQSYNNNSTNNQNHINSFSNLINNKSQIPGISTTVNNASSANGNQSTDSAMHATRHARRLYVGNLPADTTELQIGDFFNRALVASKGSESGDEPVISVYINLDKRFAFIETRTVRESAAGLSLDGVKFRSVSLRVRRPNDFIPNDVLSIKPPVGFDPSVLGIVSTQVSDGPNKMFIGGIPYNLNEDEVKSILKSFGELRAFNLIKEPTTGLSKGFAFFEYADSSVVEEACNALHGTPVGDKTLTVRRATQSSGGGGGGGVGSGANGGNAGVSGDSVGVANTATHASGLARPNGNSTLPPTKLPDLIFPSTRVIHLKDIVSEEYLNDFEKFRDIFKDIEEEARKFGSVEKIIIPRPSDKPSLATAAGDAFIKYSNTEEAESAQICLHGRKFEDRPVTAEFLDEKMFDAEQLKT